MNQITLNAPLEKERNKANKTEKSTPIQDAATECEKHFIQMEYGWSAEKYNFIFVDKKNKRLIIQTSANTKLY